MLEYVQAQGALYLSGGKGALEFPQPLDHSMDFARWVWVSQVSVIEEQVGVLDASLVTRPNCPPTLWLWLRKG